MVLEWTPLVSDRASRCLTAEADRFAADWYVSIPFPMTPSFTLQVTSDQYGSIWSLLDNLGVQGVFLDDLGRVPRMDKQLDLLQGTLEMLILKAISLSPLHGYGILLRIQQISKERLEIQQGSLYPALYRLEHHGWITSEWGESENKRRARYYRLTAAGKRRLQSEAERWNQMTAVIAGILRATPEEL